MKVIWISFGISFAILLAALGMAFMQLQDATSNFLILHFDSYQKIDFSGTITDLYLLIASGFGVVIINLLLALFFRVREHFLTTVISVASILLSSLLFTAIFVILANN